jgi:tetratricopeptide (TPR) repeat protein
MNDERLPVRLVNISGKKYKLAHEATARPLLRAAARLEAGPADLPAIDEARRLISLAGGLFDAHSVIIRGCHAAGDEDGLALARAAWMAEDVPLFWDFPDDGLFEWKTTANQPFLRCLMQSAMISAACGQLKVATRDFRRLLAINPSDELKTAVLLLACLFGLEEWNQALTLCRQSQPGPEMLWGMVLALIQGQDPAGALLAAQRAAKKHPAEGRALLQGIKENKKKETQGFVTVFAGYWKESPEAMQLLGQVLG